MNKTFIILALLFCSVILATCQTSDSYWKNLPEYIGYTNDFEGVFTKEQIKKLDSLMRSYEERTSIQICVATIPATATPEEKFEDLTLHIAKSWGVGKKETNNGIFIGIAAGYRRMRIQNGYGTEKILSDNETKHIIDSVFLPEFKTGNYYKGTFDGILEIIKVLDSNTKAGAPAFNDINTNPDNFDSTKSVFEKYYKEYYPELIYSYDSIADIHNYSNNWDFDNDGIKDQLYFVREDDLFSFYYLKIVLSANQQSADLDFIQTDFPFLSNPTNAKKLKTGFFVNDDENKPPMIIVNINKVVYNTNNKKMVANNIKAGNVFVTFENGDIKFGNL